MYSLENKVAIITGGAKGIGAAIVKIFLKEGVQHAAILDVNESAGCALEAELKLIYGERKTRFYNCDVSNDGQLFDIFHKVVEEFGNIDLVVNNAGIARDAPDMYKKQIEINFTAVVTSTLKALELMRTDEGGKGGTIINISSIAALKQLSPSVFVYGATKSAVLHFSNCIGMQEYYSNTNVRVMAMCFGGTDTEIFSKMDGIDKITTQFMRNFIEGVAVQNFLQPVEVAAQGIVECFKTGKTGSTWLVNCSKIIEITDDVQEAYKIMSRNANNN